MCLYVTFGWPWKRNRVLRAVPPPVNVEVAVDLLRERVSGSYKATAGAGWRCRACGGTDVLETSDNARLMIGRTELSS